MVMTRVTRSSFGNWNPAVSVAFLGDGPSICPLFHESAPSFNPSQSLVLSFVRSSHHPFVRSSTRLFVSMILTASLSIRTFLRLFTCALLQTPQTREKSCLVNTSLLVSSAEYLVSLDLWSFRLWFEIVASRWESLWLFLYARPFSPFSISLSVYLLLIPFRLSLFLFSPTH